MGVATATFVDTVKARDWRYFDVQLLLYMVLLIGIGVVIVLLRIAWTGRYGPAYHGPIEVGGLYWHFVDVIWIFLFACIYVWGSGGEGAAHAAGH